MPPARWPPRWIRRILAPVLRAHAIAIPLAALDGVQEAIFRRRFAFRVLALRGVIGQVAGGLTALAFAAAGAGVWTLVAFALVPFVVGTTVLWVLSPWRPGFDVSLARYRELLAFGGFTVGVNVVSLVQRRADHFLIGAMLGPAALGYYAMARQFIVAVTDPLERAINPVMWTTLCRLQGAPERLDRAVRGFATHQALILLPASLGLAASAPVLLPLLLGDTWQPSIPVLQALGCLAAVVTLASASSTAILAVGAARGRASLELIRVSVSVGALLVGMRWGIGGVGWALVLAAALLLPVQLGAARIIVPLRIAPYLGQLAVPALGAVVMAAAVVALRVVLADRLSAPVLLGVMIGGRRDGVCRDRLAVQPGAGARGARQPARGAALARGRGVAARAALGARHADGRRARTPAEAAGEQTPGTREVEAQPSPTGRRPTGQHERGRSWRESPPEQRPLARRAPPRRPERGRAARRGPPRRPRARPRGPGRGLRGRVGQPRQRRSGHWGVERPREVAEEERHGERGPAPRRLAGHAGPVEVRVRPDGQPDVAGPEQRRARSRPPPRG